MSSKRFKQTGSVFSSRVAQWTRPGQIRSIQRGTIAGAATSQTATITAVDLNNTRLVWVGIYDPSNADNPAQCAPRVELTNATTVTAYYNTSIASTHTVSFEVIEYWPGVIKSMQRGTYATTASQTGTATVTAVNTAKATLDHLGFTSTYATTSFIGGGEVMQELTNATTITATGVSAITRTVGYQLVEWF